MDWRKLRGLGAAVIDKLGCWDLLFAKLSTPERVAQFVGCSVEEIPPQPDFLHVIESAQVPQHPPAPDLGLDESLDKLLDALRDVQRAGQQLQSEARCAKVTLHARDVVAIAFPADFHIGAAGTDHSAILHIVRIIRDTPGLYCVLNGDVINNYIARSYDEERHTQPLGPGLQKEVAKHLAEALADKCIAVTSGQHEYWSLRQDDFDVGAYIARHSGAAYLGPGGELELEIRNTDDPGISETYYIGVYHAYRGTSIYDDLAAAKRCYREIGAGRWEATVVADKHAPALACQVVHGTERYFIRAGTAKLDDLYARRLGFTNSRFYVPVLLFWATQHRLQGFIKLSEGLEALAAHIRS